MRIALLFGGESVEHEISIISAIQVYNALLVEHKVYPLYIDKNNQIYYSEKLSDFRFYRDLSKNLKKKMEVSLFHKGKRSYFKRKGPCSKKIYFDLAFPIVHGKGMEDGTIHGFLKFLKIPSVASNLAFLSICQDKILTKKILKSENIETVDYVLCDHDLKESLNRCLKLSFPMIVKPCNLGSSVGVTKVNDEKELESAIIYAFAYDSKVIVEPLIRPVRELNISVLRKDGEIITSSIEEVGNEKDILSFKDKYESNNNDKGMASLKREIPAKIDKELENKIREIATKVYLLIDARGVIRIDFLVGDKIYLNEVNAIPGSYSFYLWKDQYDFVELLDIVINEAKRDTFLENKLIKSYDKMDIFSRLENKLSSLKK